MKAWKVFEKDCYKYLNDTYGSICIFEPLGDSDSTKPDIRAICKNNEKFYIETKEKESQCGQFVLFPDLATHEFEYSTKNKSSLNHYSREIINYMNCNFTDFLNAGTKGCSIDLPKEIFYNWIKKYYLLKGVRFFITKFENDYIVFPVEKFEKYFDVSAKYRVKKSGSSDPARSNIPEIMEILNENKIPYEISIKDKKTFIKTATNINGVKLLGKKYSYLFNEIEQYIYNVRKLSNTKNANVIFSIKLKNTQDNEDLQFFKNSIA